MDELTYTILEKKSFQFFIDLGVLGLCFYYIKVGLAINAGTLDVYILLKACASAKAIPEIVDMSESVILFFSSMTGVVSNLGMVGVLSGSVGAVQSYSVLGHVLLSFELLYFATVYFHVDYLKSELESCLKDMAVQTYEGPWSDDPTSLSFVIDTYQLKYTCCGFADPNDFENGTAWNRKWKDSQDNEVEAVRPWTCCRLANMAEGNKVYDPTVQTFEVVTGTGDNAFLQSDRCTFDKGSGNDQTCTQRYLEEIEDKTMYGFLIPGLLLIFAQAVGCSLGAYNCKATRNSKVFI